MSSSLPQASIYVIGTPNGPYKIGWSADVQSRLVNLQVGQSEALSVFYEGKVEASKAPIIEKLIQRQVAHCRIRGEWYGLPLEDAIAEVQYGIIRWEDEPNLVFKFKKKLL